MLEDNRSINALYEIPNFDKFDKSHFLREFEIFILYNEKSNKLSFYSFANLSLFKTVFLDKNGEISDIVTLTTNFNRILYCDCCIVAY